MRRADLVIPVCAPDGAFPILIRRVCRQRGVEVARVILMITGDSFDQEEEVRGILAEKGIPLSLQFLEPADFDHGGTRNAGVRLGNSETVICMTQDALPSGSDTFARLLEALYPENGRPDGAAPEADAGQADEVRAGGTPLIAAAYARQLPKKRADIAEQLSRAFNYPKEGRLQTEADLPELGIRTYFCSNVCAAYRRSVWEALGGFPEPMVFNEDMVFAARAQKAGYAVAYAAQACVYHSHRYTAKQQFKRSFDLGVSQAMHPEVFEGVPSEGEGIAYVRRVTGQLLRSVHPAQAVRFIWQSGWKYIGYRLGRHYRRLPRLLVLTFTGTPAWWEKNE